MFHRIKLFELMSDRLEIVKVNNIKFPILFSDIKSMKFFGREKGSLVKQLSKEADAMKWQEFPYYVGIEGASGKILISRKSGVNRLRYLLPWLNTLEKSRHYSLCPSEPKEFFDQLCVAYEKWRRTNVKGNQ